LLAPIHGRVASLSQGSQPRALEALFEILGVNADQPVGRPFGMIATPPQPGEYEFTCQIHTYRGTLVVRLYRKRAAIPLC